MPNEGSENIFCILSSIAHGKELREGDMVEYETEYDDRRGKYQAIKMTRKAGRHARKKRTKLP
jgi:cold shock CspA family protein